MSHLNLLGGSAVRPDGVPQTSWGAPTADMSVSQTAGQHGPLLMDTAYMDKIQHFDRERIPERVVHALGVGVHGYFEATEDISAICKARVFGAVGKRTDAFVRFSSVVAERGAADTERDVRGFAIKMYTEDGTWDLVCNNMPIFFVRDPMLFPDLIHALKRNPRTDMKDATAFWDFMAGRPESAHLLSMLYADRGVPASYRNMHGFGNHTFVMVNQAGDRTFVKFHIVADAGVANLSSDAAEAARGADTDFLRRDLVEYISSGGEVSYTMNLQIIPEADAGKLPYDIFDVTKVVPHSDYPLRPVGKLVLNRLVDNFFAETEQAAFAVSNLVPGIEASNDRILQGRLLSYPDTQLHRLGPNFRQLPINYPRFPVRNHQRDGLMAYRSPGDETPYFTGCPMSGTLQGRCGRAHESAFVVHGIAGRSEFKPADPDADFVQPRRFYRKVLTEEERTRLAYNIVGHLQQASAAVHPRIVAMFGKVDQDLGRKLEEQLAAVMAGSAMATSTKEPSGKAPELLSRRVKAGSSIVELSKRQLALGSPRSQPGREHPDSQPFVSGAAAADAAARGTLKGVANAVAAGVKGVVQAVSALHVVGGGGHAEAASSNDGR